MSIFAHLIELSNMHFYYSQINTDYNTPNFRLRCKLERFQAKL